MILHPVAVAPDVDDVAVVHQPVDEGRRHHLVAPFAAAPGIDALIASRFRHTPLAFAPYRPQGRTTPLPRPLTSASPVQRLVAGPNLGPPPGLHDDFTAAPPLQASSVAGDQCGDIHTGVGTRGGVPYQRSEDSSMAPCSGGLPSLSRRVPSRLSESWRASMSTAPRRQPKR